MTLAVGLGFGLLVLLAVWIVWPLFGLKATEPQTRVGDEGVRSRQAMLAAEWEDLESDRLSRLVGDEEYAQSQQTLKDAIKSLQKEARTGLVILVVMLAARPATAQLPAEVGGEITGQVVTTEKTMKIPSGLEVELHSSRKGVAGPLFQTVLDADGHFAMKDLLVHPDLRYYFALHVMGTTYTSNVVGLTQEEPKAEVEIPIFPVTDSKDQMHLSLVHDLLKVETRSADVLELVGIEQSGTDGYGGGKDGGITLPLPAGYGALEQVGGSVPVVDAPGKGALIMGPFPPGQVAVAFDYRLPVAGDQIDVTRSFPMALDRFGVFLNVTGVGIDPQGMLDEGLKTVEGRDYHVYSHAHLAADEKVAYSLSNFPKPPRDWRPWYAVFFGSVLLLAFVATLARGAGKPAEGVKVAP